MATELSAIYAEQLTEISLITCTFETSPMGMAGTGIYCNVLLSSCKLLKWWIFILPHYAQLLSSSSASHFIHICSLFVLVVLHSLFMFAVLNLDIAVCLS